MNAEIKVNLWKPLMPHEVPDRPWVKFTFNKQTYNATVDYYFIEMDRLRDTSYIITKDCKSILPHFYVHSTVHEECLKTDFTTWSLKHLLLIMHI